MAVADMIVKFSEASGVKNTNAAAREQILRYLNTAGRELWNSWDLPGCLNEQFFAIPYDQAITQISLPWYCEQIRGVRWAITGQKLTVHDARPRYHATPWHQPSLTWRVRRRMPLHTPMAAEGPLTFTLDTAQEDPITITVAGQTTTASNALETIVLTPGVVAATTNNQWSMTNPYGITSITKNVITTCDVLCFDMTGLAVAEIGSRSNAANNILVQIGEYASSAVYQPDNTIEMLYKLPYEELYYDQDVFHSPYAEDALIWRARANWASLQMDEMSLQRASAMASKAEELIRQIVANQENEMEMTISFAPNRYASPRNNYRRGGWKYDQVYRRY